MINSWAKGLNYLWLISVKLQDMITSQILFFVYKFQYKKYKQIVCFFKNLTNAAQFERSQI